MYKIQINLSIDEVTLLLSIMNEVYNGIQIRDFDNKVGSRKSMVDLWKKIKDQEHANGFILKINNEEQVLLINSFNEVLKNIDEWEFETRTGFEKQDAISLKNRFDSISGK